MPILARQNRQHSAADTALGRQSDLYQPLAGAVVHPAGCHDTEDLFDACGCQRALVG